MPRPIPFADRRKMETDITRMVVESALGAGYSVAACDGEEIHPASTDVDAIVATLMAVDESTLILYRDGRRAGWVFFVYGNDGWDVVCDYSTTIETMMERANAESDRLMETYAN